MTNTDQDKAIRRARRQKRIAAIRATKGGLGLLAINFCSGFCVIKRQMQGANRSKVGHLARICNAADAVLGRKSRQNVACQQPPNE